MTLEMTLAVFCEADAPDAAREALACSDFFK